jgi:hypothetical protein
VDGNWPSVKLAPNQRSSLRRNILDVGQTVSRLAGRRWVALAVTVAVLLVELLPMLGDSPGAGTDLVLASLALLAVAVVVHAASWSMAAAPDRALFSPAPDDDSPVLSRPATDPTHHPLAPRAPGLA